MPLLQNVYLSQSAYDQLIAATNHIDDNSSEAMERIIVLGSEAIVAAYDAAAKDFSDQSPAQV